MIQHVAVRMYEMGFGDCFLVTFRSGSDSTHILFDCGSLSRPKAEVARVARDVIAACSGSDSPARLALVVCSHRHKDHVSGFDDPIWAEVEVGEVWMPWTEDPDDPVATRIRNRQSSLARALYGALASAPVPDDEWILPPRAGDDAVPLSLALNALTNAKAMATLHRGFAGNPKRRFLPSKDSVAEVRTLEDLPGVRIHVLGPSRDEAVIKEMDPPDGEAYLSAASQAHGSERSTGACESKWRVDEVAFGKSQPAGSSFFTRDQKGVDRLAEESDGDLAAALDQAVNNTSLVLVIEVGDQLLLFPGDAQWGTWKAALERPETRSMLGRTTLLKVSHHGSHNGTPRALVDDILGEDVVALVSTEPVSQWPGIPRAPLMDALDARATVVRSDQAHLVKRDSGFAVQDGLYISWETSVAVG